MQIKTYSKLFFECSECSRKREEKTSTHTVQHSTIEVSRHSKQQSTILYEMSSFMLCTNWKVMFTFNVGTSWRGRECVLNTKGKKRLFAAFWFGNWMKWASAYANKRNKGECELLCKLRGELSSRCAVWAAHCNREGSVSSQQREDWCCTDILSFGKSSQMNTYFLRHWNMTKWIIKMHENLTNFSIWLLLSLWSVTFWSIKCNISDSSRENENVSDQRQKREEKNNMPKCPKFFFGGELCPVWRRENVSITN